MHSFDSSIKNMNSVNYITCLKAFQNKFSTKNQGKEMWAFKSENAFLATYDEK